MKTAHSKIKTGPVSWAYHFVAEFFTTFRWREHAPALGIIALACLVVLVCWIAVYLVDALGAYEMGAGRGMWWHLFRNRGPVEWGQWVFLSLTSLSAAAFVGIYRERKLRKDQIFWALVSASFMLMFIEDAGDPRHVLAEYGALLYGIRRMRTEAVFFIFILSPLVIALLRYWKVATSVPPQTRFYFLLGGFFYGVAASSSLFREQGGFYHILGERLSQSLTYGNVPAFYLMDFVLEESLELVAASIIFAGILMFWKTGLGRPKGP